MDAAYPRAPLGKLFTVLLAPASQSALGCSAAALMRHNYGKILSVM